MNETVYTDHLIDDKAAPHEALEAFKSQFPLSGCKVYAKGRIMNYRLSLPRNTTAWEKLANLIIKQLNLPLEAFLENWYRNEKLFEVNLCIEFKET